MNTKLDRLIKHYLEHESHDDKQLRKYRDSGENLQEIIETCAEYMTDTRISKSRRRVLSDKMGELASWMSHYNYTTTDFDTIFTTQQAKRKIKNTDESFEWLKLTSGIIKEYVECEAWLQQARTKQLHKKITSTIDSTDLFEPVKRAWE